MQDIEFSVYGHVYQAGRNGSGTAGMGGNGQFNRLSALDAIATGSGPWRNRLTEDQDLGLRLLDGRLEVAPGAAGVVEQQGVPQRAAAAAPAHALVAGQPAGARPDRRRSGARRSRRHARLEEVAYLLMPVWQAMIGVAARDRRWCSRSRDEAFLDRRAVVAAAGALLLGFGAVIFGCIASSSVAGGEGPRRAAF